MKKYYLVVRYEDTNEVQAIELSTKWYLEKQDKDVFFRANSLEAIDLVTTRFKNSEEMLLRMKNNGYIRSSKADVFIASKRKKDGHNYIKIHEVIYNPLADERVNDLRSIAKASINNDISLEIEKVKKVFDKLAHKVFYDEKFSLYLRSTFTNVYQKLMELYVYNKKDGPAYSIKYDNYWLLSSYTIIRNIVEALNRFDLLKDKSDVVLANIEFLNKSSVGRKKAEADLIEKLDENYIAGQYSLFDNVESSESFDNTTSKVSEETGVRKDNEINEVAENVEISLDEKKIFIYDVVKSLPAKIFKHSDDGIVVNSDFFEKYPNNVCKSKFINLPKRIISILYYHSLHLEKYYDAVRYCQNTMEWDSELRKDMARLNKFLSSSKNVDKLDEWCHNYLKCVEFETLALDLDECDSYEESEGFGSKKSMLK